MANVYDVGGELEEGLQYLHQVWPLIQGGRAAQATLEKAAETARYLRQDFRGPNLDSEVRVFLDGVLEQLRDYDEGEPEASGWVSGYDATPDPKTGRTTRCNTSTPWWREVLHAIAHGVAKYFGGEDAAKLTDQGIALVQSETDKMDGNNLRKWFNEETNPGIVVWGIAHAKGFVDDAWKKTDHDWPLRRAALQSLGVTPETFAGSETDQRGATLKVMLFSSAFGGIKWSYARHVTEALLLQRYATIAPLVPIIETRGGGKYGRKHGERPKDKKSWATTAGPYVTATLGMLQAAAVGLPPALPSAPAPPPTPAPASPSPLGSALSLLDAAKTPPAEAPPAPAATAGADLPANIGPDTRVFSPRHGRWGRIECYAPLEGRPGRMLGLRFESNEGVAVEESEVLW